MRCDVTLHFVKDYRYLVPYRLVFENDTYLYEYLSITTLYKFNKRCFINLPTINHNHISLIIKELTISTIKFYGDDTLTANKLHLYFS